MASRGFPFSAHGPPSCTASRFNMMGRRVDKQSSPAPQSTFHGSQSFPPTFVYPLGVSFFSPFTICTEHESCTRHGRGTGTRRSLGRGPYLECSNSGRDGSVLGLLLHPQKPCQLLRPSALPEVACVVYTYSRQ